VIAFKNGRQKPEIIQYTNSFLVKTLELVRKLEVCVQVE